MVALSRVLARFVVLAVPLAPVAVATPPVSPGPAPAAYAAARAHTRPHAGPAAETGNPARASTGAAAPPHYPRSQDDRDGRRGDEGAPPGNVDRTGVDLTRARAQWIDRATVAWRTDVSGGSRHFLAYSPKGDIHHASGELRGDIRLIRLRPGTPTAAQRRRYPHLFGGVEPYAALRVDPRDAGRVTEALRGQVVAVARDASGRLRAATGVQLPGVLDDVYAAAAKAPAATAATESRRATTAAGAAPSSAVRPPRCGPAPAPEPSRRAPRPASSPRAPAAATRTEGSGSCRAGRPPPQPTHQAATPPPPALASGRASSADAAPPR